MVANNLLVHYISYDCNIMNIVTIKCAWLCYLDIDDKFCYNASVTFTVTFCSVIFTTIRPIFIYEYFISYQHKAYEAFSSLCACT